MSGTVVRAIIPAAGLGTRLLPITRVIPKEMLPLGRKPVLEHVLAELRTCGIKHVLMVISPTKTMIQQYFGDGNSFGLAIDYVVQATMLGLGDAIRLGADWSRGETCAVAFGDTVHRYVTAPPLQRAIQLHTDRNATATTVVEPVACDQVFKYGIIAPTCPEDYMRGVRAIQFSTIVEKPEEASAPSNLAVAGRWVLGAPVLTRLLAASPGVNGELDLTSSVDHVVSRGGAGWAIPLDDGETRVDIGSWPSYLQAMAFEAAHQA